MEKEEGEEVKRRPGGRRRKKKGENWLLVNSLCHSKKDVETVMILSQRALDLESKKEDLALSLTRI